MRNTSMRDALEQSLPSERARAEERKNRTERMKSSFQKRVVPFKPPASETITAVLEAPPEPTPSEPTLPEVDAVVSAIEEQAATEQAPPQLPPSSLDTAGVDLASPFGPALHIMVGKLLDARTKLAFALEGARSMEARKQQAVEIAQRELEQAQVYTAGIKTQLKNIEETISSCTLVSEQSLQIAPLLTPVRNKAVVVAGEVRLLKGVRPEPNDPTILRHKDIHKFFAEHPGREWNKNQIIQHLPLHQREHAKRSLPVILSTMAATGFIKRVDRGLYRLKS